MQFLEIIVFEPGKADVQADDESKNEAKRKNDVFVRAIAGVGQRKESCCCQTSLWCERIGDWFNGNVKTRRGEALKARVSSTVFV